ncbi:GDP-mannose 4,6-dehydratase [Enterococcus faecalis]|uniref:GDP-mannose 4,6-dehydratase n=1 Tax=Enterococcus faecalis TaxID=1351 RepID=UPI0024555653|nr:GDP-mannose 4,6-dehydratase [Enterococcus faecalis]MDH5041006.1 GDP-mannose 4,6-dehydratase [Enterococcus faecalis]
MKKLLITGGAGFIGSNLANFYSQQYQVFVIDDLSMGQVSNLQQTEQLVFIKGSVTDQQLLDEVLSKHSFEYIFHLAAVASVASSVAQPLETHEVNFLSVLKILESIKKYQKKLKRFVFASSAAVYGAEPTLPKTETSVICPLSPYAIDKFAAERYVLNEYHLHGVPTSAVRFFNVYGPNQNPSSPYSGVLSILMDRYIQLEHGQASQFQIFGDGQQTRDFIYIEDVLTALNLVATKSEALGHVYNVGTEVAISLNQLIEEMNQLVGLSLPISYQKERDGDIKYSLSDSSALKRLGFSPVYSIQEGLQKYLKFTHNTQNR